MIDSRDDRLEKLSESVKLISKKWHPIIIQRLHEEGPLRFNELQEALEEISAKVLSENLEELVENELVDRTVISESPKKVEYRLTSDGEGLQSVLTSLATWGEQYLEPDPSVLIIDDDPRLARMYSDWLDDTYSVTVAFNGEDGLNKLSDDVDLVLLDRRMPGLSGERVLEHIRDMDLDTHVIILSAVEPDLDIVDMDFDAYIVKPGIKEVIRDVVTEVLTRDSYDEHTQEFLILNAKRALLLSRLSQAELRNDPNYQQLLERLDELEESIDDPTEEVDSTDRVVAMLDNETS